LEEKRITVCLPTEILDVLYYTMTRGNLTIKYKDIIEAKDLLNLPERASMEEIK
jgi:hypothetical protein